MQTITKWVSADEAIDQCVCETSLWSFDVRVIDEGGRITVILTDDTRLESEFRLAQVIERVATEFYRAWLSHVPVEAIRWIERLIYPTREQWSEIRLAAVPTQLAAPQWRSLPPSTIRSLRTTVSADIK